MMTFWTSQAINGFQTFPNYSFLEWTKLIKTISVCGSQRFFLPSFLASCMEQNVWQKKMGSYGGSRKWIGPKIG